MTTYGFDGFTLYAAVTKAELILHNYTYSKYVYCVDSVFLDGTVQ